MTTKAAIEDFLSQRTFAIAGVSRNGKKFGNAVIVSLKQKGYRMMPVHPSAAQLEGEPCSKSLRDLPQKADGLILVVPPAESEKLVEEAFDAGIRRVWFQTGAESSAAIDFCREHAMSEVHGECILMFAEPAEFFHRAHRFIRRVSGALPR